MIINWRKEARLFNIYFHYKRVALLLNELEATALHMPWEPSPFRKLKDYSHSSVNNRNKRERVINS